MVAVKRIERYLEMDLWLKSGVPLKMIKELNLKVREYMNYGLNQKC